jgi:putative transposase
VDIKAAHMRTSQSYGAERLQHDLAEYGIQVGVCRIKRIRRKLGLRCKQKRKFRVITDSWHRLPVAENLRVKSFRLIDRIKSGK